MDLKNAPCTYTCFAEALTVREESEERWERIKTYQKEGTLLEGTVTEVRPGARATYAVVQLEGFDVLIPDIWFVTDRFFNNTFAQASEEEKARRRFQCLRAAMGATVCFVIKRAEVTGSVRTDYAILASRTEAMESLKRKWFFSDDLPPEKRIEPGKVIRCDVLTSGENGVRVQSYGVDFYISRRQLSLVHPVLDARDWFSPGDSFYALVQKAYANEDGSVYLQASVRQLEHERIKSGYENATVGSTVAGYVCDYNSEKHSYTIVLSCGCYANCHQNSVIGGETLALGDSVSVHIKEKRSGFVTGSCLRIHNLSKPRNMIYGWD